MSDQHTYLVRGRRISKVNTMTVGVDVNDAVDAVRRAYHPDEFIVTEARLLDHGEVLEEAFHATAETG